MKNLRSWSARLPLRDWQQRAVEVFQSLGKSDALFVATPGGGKTFFALKCAHDLMRAGKVERVVVVTPTNHLRRQWAEASASCGIDIDPDWSNSNGVEAKDYSGVAVTYQQVSYAPDLYDLNCRRKTLVILDEVHHAGDSLDWGEKLRAAFRGATYRLSLSGTPFRNDNQQIPFVAYADNRSQADFTYGYGQALADGVCRPIYFPTVEGDVSWLRGSGEEMNCSLLDSLSKTKAAERLRATLDTAGNWMKDVLREADARLTKMRRDGHSDAAGLVIAIDQHHARQIALLLKSITHEQPALVISDEDNSSDVIREFARAGNAQRWIVAVKMVSEGVDIPRLRVGVYATTVQSELFFRQAVGRFVRTIPGLEEQSAALFIPADSRLMHHALAIKEEREHHLRAVVKVEDDRLSKIANVNENDFGYSDAANGQADTKLGEFESGESGLEAKNSSLSKLGKTGENAQSSNSNSFRQNYIVPLSSTAKTHVTIFDGARYSAEELQKAATLSRELGINLPSPQVAALLRYGVNASAVNETASAAPVQSGNQTEISEDENNQSAGKFSEANTLKSDRKNALRKEINRMANRLAHKFNVEFDAVHRYWIQQNEGSSHRDATEEELRRKFQWLVASFNQKSFAADFPFK